MISQDGVEALDAGCSPACSVAFPRDQEKSIPTCHLGDRWGYFTCDVGRILGRIPLGDASAHRIGMDTCPLRRGQIIDTPPAHLQKDEGDE